MATKATRRKYTYAGHWNGKLLNQLLTPVCQRWILPGETIQQVTHKLRYISELLKRQMSSANFEVFGFMTPLSAIYDIDTIDTWINARKTMLEPEGAEDLSRMTYTGASKAWRFAEEAIMREFFSVDDALPPKGFGKYKAGLTLGSSLAIAIDQLPAEGATNVDLDADGTITSDEVRQALADYWMSVLKGDNTRTYAEFLRDAGVKVSVGEKKAVKPELIYYGRRFDPSMDRFDPAGGKWKSIWKGEVSISRSKRYLAREPSVFTAFALQRPFVWFENAKYADSTAFGRAIDFDPEQQVIDPVSALIPHPLDGNRHVSLSQVLALGDRLMSASVSDLGIQLKGTYGTPTMYPDWDALQAATYNSSTTGHTHAISSVFLNVTAPYVFPPWVHQLPRF